MIKIYVVLARAAKGGGTIGASEELCVETPDRSGDAYEHARQEATRAFAEKRGIPINQVYHFGSF